MAATTTPTQSATLESLLGAIETVLSFSTRLDLSAIVESYDDDRPRYEGSANHLVVYRFISEDPFIYAGAGREAHPEALVLEIILYTRLGVGPAGQDKIWARDQGRGAFVMRQSIRNAFQDCNLFTSYDWDAKEMSGETDQYGQIAITGQPLTTEPLQQLKSPSPFALKSKKDETWGDTRLYFQVMTLQPLVIPDTSS